MPGYPWYGRNYNFALEPWTSYPDGGLLRAIENGSARRIGPLETIETRLLAVAYAGTERITGIDATWRDYVVKTLAGVFAPIGTPFREDEEVDFAALEFNMGVYARSGILGYLALGSNGENKSLTEDEKLAVLRTIVAGRADDQVVMAGATYEAQRDTERFFDVAADIGADFGLLLSPSYFRKQMTDEVLFRYFTTAADHSPIPLLVYNAPGFSGVTVSPGLIGRLAGHPNIVGMKDSGSSGIEAFLAYESASLPRAGGLGQLPLPGDDGGLHRRHGVAGRRLPGHRHGALSGRGGAGRDRRPRLPGVLPPPQRRHQRHVWGAGGQGGDDPRRPARRVPAPPPAAPQPRLKSPPCGTS